MLTVDDIRYDLADAYASGRFVGNTVEIVGSSFIADEPTIFGLVNNDYVARELDWYKSGSLNVNDIPGGAPAIWKRVATPTGEINSNYGHLFLSEENGNQIEHVVRHLLQDPQSRRATAVYTRPSIHEDWNRDGMQDFICTNAVQYFLRSGRLQVVVQMRSNDVVFGYRNDYAWHRYAQQLVIDDLKSHDVHVVAGGVVWQASSLHIYDRHFWILDEFIKSGNWQVSVS